MSLDHALPAIPGYSDFSRIASGYVSSVFTAQLAGVQVIVKVVRNDHARDGAEAEGVANEAKVLRRLNGVEDPAYYALSDARARLAWAQATAGRRTIIALLDHGIDPQLGPFVVQEMAPPEYRPQPASSLQEELRTLRVIGRVASGISTAHNSSYSLRDFEPHSKGDRIRMRWDEDAAEPQVKIIDWNVTGGPELFDQDLVNFGRLMYYYLMGTHLELTPDGLPPHSLGLGVEGWKVLSEGTRLILGKLLDRDKSQRYHAAEELDEDLAWHVRSMALAVQPSQIDRLRDRASQALTQGRYDRLLAVSALGLGADAPADLRRALQPLHDTARAELGKKLRVALAMITVSMTSHQYRQAIVEADQQLVSLDARSEAAQRVRYIKLQALVGLAFRALGHGGANDASAWIAVERGVEQMGRAWDDAARAFDQAAALAPCLVQLPEFQKLRNVSAAWNRFERAVHLHRRSQAGAGAEKAPNWLELEQSRLAFLEQAVDELDAAVRLAPEEILLTDAQGLYRKELDRRREDLEGCRAIEDALAMRDYGAALSRLEETLRVNPDCPRARYLQPDAEYMQRFQDALRNGQAALAQGRYADARLVLPQVEDPRLDPEGAALRARSLADAGHTISTRVLELLGRAEQAGDMRTAWDALEQVRRIEAGPSMRSLAEAFGLALPAEVDGEQPFVPTPLLQRIRSATQEITESVEREARRALDEARKLWERGQFGQAATRVSGSLAELPEIGVIRADLELAAEQYRRAAEQCTMLSAAVNGVAVNRHEKSKAGVRIQIEQLVAALREFARTPAGAPAVLPPALTDDAQALAKAAEDALSAANAYLPFPTSGSWRNILPQDLADLLVERLAVHSRAQAAAAGEMGEFGEAERWWAQLEQLAGLNADEDRLRTALQEQSAVLGGLGPYLDRVETLLASKPPQTRDAHDLLVQAMTKLNALDPSPDANELRRRAGALWVNVVKEAATPTVGNEYCGTARELLREPTLVGRLASLVPVLSAGQQVESGHIELLDALTQEDESEAANSTADAELAAVFRILDERLVMLYAPTSWPVMRRWAQQVQANVVGALNGWLDRRLLELREALQEKNYDAAALVAKRVEDLGLTPRWTAGVANCLKSITTETAGAKQVREARAALEELRQQLDDPSGLLGSDDGAKAVAGLQPSLGDDDYWQKGRTLLALGQELAQVHRTPPPESEFARAMNDALTVSGKARTAAAPHGELWEAWRKRHVEDAAAKCQQRVVESARQLAKELVCETEAATARPELDLDQLRQLYWEARWARVTLRRESADAVMEQLEQALQTAASALPKLTLERIKPYEKGLYYDDQRASSWAGVREVVRALQSWRASLAERPKEGVRLPPYPGVREDFKLPHPPSKIVEYLDGIERLLEQIGEAEPDWIDLDKVFGLLGAAEPAIDTPMTEPPALQTPTPIAAKAEQQATDLPVSVTSAEGLASELAEAEAMATSEPISPKLPVEEQESPRVAAETDNALIVTPPPSDATGRGRNWFARLLGRLRRRDDAHDSEAAQNQATADELRGKQ